MIRRSPEIEAVVRRWADRVNRHEVADLPHMLSQSAALLYIGTSHDEIWRNRVVREGIADHLAEVPDFIERGVEVEAWENGDTGWAFYTCRFEVPRTGFTGIHRATFVFVLERGSWKMVQHHISQPDSNMETLGIEHSALRRLVEAARAESHDFGTEGFASIMFTDIVNSSPIAAALGDRAWGAIVSAHFQALREAVGDHGGHFVKSLGDGSLSSFVSARSALAAARAIQSCMAAQTSEPRLVLRIGLHTGDVVQSENDFFGSVVNKAARITDCAGPGEVAVSDVTRAMVGETPDFIFGNYELVQLKGFKGDHGLYKLQWQS